jgi:CubicO group peptidase (beta-lactamase class C family)
MAMSNLLPEGASTSDALIRGAGFGAGGRVSSEYGTTIFGWAGAAGTVAFVDPVRKIRFGGYANYMPPTIYDFQEQIPRVLVRDLSPRP